MDLSNLRPADGAKQSDNFRRGRGHGSGNDRCGNASRGVIVVDVVQPNRFLPNRDCRSVVAKLAEAGRCLGRVHRYL